MPIHRLPSGSDRSASEPLGQSGFSVGILVFHGFACFRIHLAEDLFRETVGLRRPVRRDDQAVVRHASRFRQVAFGNDFPGRRAGRTVKRL